MKFLIVCFLAISFFPNYALNPMISIGEFMTRIIKVHSPTSYESLEKCYPDELAILRKLFCSIGASPANKNLTSQMYKGPNIIKNCSNLTSYLDKEKYLLKTFGEVNKEFIFQELSEKEKWVRIIMNFQKVIEGYEKFLSAQDARKLQNLYQNLKDEFSKISDFSDTKSKLYTISEYFINEILKMNPFKLKAASEPLRSHLWQFLMLTIDGSSSCGEVVKNIFVNIDQMNRESFIAGRVFGSAAPKLVEKVIEFLKIYAISNNLFERSGYASKCVDILRCVAIPNNIKIPIQCEQGVQNGFYSLKELFKLKNLRTETINDFYIIRNLAQKTAETALIAL